MYVCMYVCIYWTRAMNSTHMIHACNVYHSFQIGGGSLANLFQNVPMYAAVKYPYHLSTPTSLADKEFCLPDCW